MNSNKTTKTLAVALIALSIAFASPALALAKEGKGNGKGDDKKEQVQKKESKFEKWSRGLHLGFVNGFPYGIWKKFHLGTTTRPTPTENNATLAISSVSIQNINSSGAKISWKTNIAASGKVFYGTVTPVDVSSSGQSIVAAGTNRDHTVNLTGLNAGVLYRIVLSSTDQSGNTVNSGEYSFTTLSTSTPEASAPVIYGINVFSISQTSANVFWATNENANGRVYYSTTSPVLIGGSQTLSVSASPYTMWHSLGITGLTRATTYYYVIVSADSAGNTSTSTQGSFVTASASDTTSPVVSNIVATIGTSTAKITWTTDESANSKVLYSTTSPVSLLSPFVSSPTLGTGHEINLSGLNASTTYYYTVMSSDGTGNTSTVTGNSFMMP